MSAKSPIGISTIITVLGVVLMAVFSFSFKQIEDTKDSVAKHEVKLAEHELKINNVNEKLDLLTKQNLMLNSKVEEGNNAILKAIHDKK